MQEGCSACHSAAEQAPSGLFSCAFGGTGGIEESRRCLQCHQELGEHALHPHSLDPTLLADQATGGSHTTQQILSRLLVSPATTSTGEMACATCHHEHQGAAFDLTAMTNAQCQSCHSSTFHSLTDGHPEFSDRSRADLHFDHVTHLNLHFSSFERTMPAGVPRMRCQDCHVADAGGATMKLQSFDVMCASCHSRQIDDFEAESSARLHELVFWDWQTTDTDEPAYPPFMELMFDEAAADDGGPEELISGLVDTGEETIRQRLHMVVNPETEASVIEASISALRQSHFFEAVAMFANEQSQATEAAENTSYGPWQLLDGGTRLVYDCNQHADAVLRAWIDLAAANVSQYPDVPDPDPAGRFDRLFRDLTAPESTGRCMKCHTLEQQAGGGFQVNWKSQHGNQTSRKFTEFSHKPHLTLHTKQQVYISIVTETIKK